MADGYISQIKTPDNKVYDFRDQHLKVYTGSCTTAAGTAIKDVVTDGIFTLEKGAVLFVNFTNTNSAAVGNLKLKINGEADTNAKPIKYLVNGNDPANIPGAGYLRANQTYMFRYDGTNWVADLNYYTYSNDFANKIGHYNNILARKAIAAESLIVGDETGYEKVASGVTFNLAYPIVWCTGAVNANASNYANMFLQHYDRNIATGAKSGFTSTANKVIYLIVTINGNIATIDSNVITDTLPSSDDGKVYISLGKLGAQSTGANYFFLYPVHPMFWYKNGAIREYGGGSGIKDITRSGTTFTATRDDGSTFNFTQQDTNKYHKSGSWSGLTYTATAVNSADELKFTIPNKIQTNWELNAASGNSPALLFTRDGSLTDWRMLVTSGKLSFQSATDGSTWTERAYFKDNSGDFVATSFTGKGSDLTDLNGSNISSGTVAAARIDSAIARLASPALTGVPTAPTAANGTSTTQIATTAFVNNTLSYVNAMRFKGTLGTGGTATALPASHEAGDTYRVITAGTWAGEDCAVGTLIICTTDGTTANDAHWACVGTNEDGTMIGPESSTDNAIARFDGTTGRVIQNSKATIDDNGYITLTHIADNSGELNIKYGSTIDYWWGVGATNENHGLYDRKAAQWILSAGAANTWTFDGNATTATTATNLSAAPSITSGGTATVTLSANTAYTLTVGGKSIVFKTPVDEDTDTKVNVTAAATAITRNYLLMTSIEPTSTATGHTALGSTRLWVNAVNKGKFELVLGNATATTTSGGQFGQLALYSASTAGTYLNAADGTAWKTATLPAATGMLAMIENGTAKGSNTKPVKVAATGLITECSTYAGGTAVTLNDTNKSASTASFYAPTEAGTADQVLVSTTGTPTWRNDRGIEFIVGTWTAASNTWTGVSTDSALYDGKQIILYMPFAGTSSAATLNLTLSDGTTTGAKNVYFESTTRFTTHKGQNAQLHLIYHSGLKLSNGTTYEGWWYIANRDTDNDYRTCQNVLADTDANNRSLLLANPTVGTANNNTSYVTYRNDKIYANVNTGIITATGFDGDLTGNADTATAANLTSTANAVAYYTNTTGTFGSKASANGALYATSANGALQWGTLPIAQGGTGVVSFTKNQVILSDNTNGTTGLTSRAYSDSSSAGALSNTSTNFVTERDVYFGLPTLNNAHNYASSSTYYAPTTGGTAGHVLIGAGATTAPAWYGGTVMSGTAAASWKTAFNGTTDATATNAAAVTIAGGLGIGKKLYVGSTVTALNLTIGSTNEYGDAYTPIYWHEGVPTAVTLVQQCAFTIKNGKSGVRLSHAAITVDSYVTEIVITSGESKLNSAISWTSAAGYIELTCSSTVSGDVTGYIMISRGGKITATATDIT